MKLPEVIPSVRLRQPTPFGNMHLHISVDPETGREREVFAQLGKGGDLANSDLEAICRLVSLLLRLDGDISTVIDQLEGIGSSLSVPTKDGRIKSLGDGLARALRKYVAAKERDGLDALLVRPREVARLARVVERFCRPRRTRKPSSRSSARTVTRPGRSPSRKAA